MGGEVELLGERIAEQAAHLDAATHLLLANLREFDARGGWHLQGAKTCAHWLAWRVGWDLITARQRVLVTQRLGKFPATDDALRRGELSYSKVRAILRVATPANEAYLLDCARLSTASQLENLTRKYARVQAHDKDASPRDDEQRRYVRRRDTYDGMVKIEAVLHPEEAELVWTMLDHAAKTLTREPHVAPSRTSSAESPVPAAPTHTDVAEEPIASLIDDSAESPASHLRTHAAESPLAPLRTDTTGSSAASLIDDSAESPTVALRTHAAESPAQHLCTNAAESPTPHLRTVALEAPTAPPLNDFAESPTPHLRTVALEAPTAPPLNDFAESPTPHLRTVVPESPAVPLVNGSAESAPHLRADAGEPRATHLLNDFAESPAPLPRTHAAESPAPRPPSVLRQAEDATKRAFSRADALMAVAQTYLRGDRPNRTPVDVMITIPWSTLRDGAGDAIDAGLMGHSCIGAEAARRISCDAGVIEVVEGEDGVPLSVGRKRRTISGSIKRALLKRDTSCTFPGCDNRVFLEGHHVRHWADGGATGLSNILLLCTLCRARHKLH